MRNPYTRPGGMFGRRNAGGFSRAGAASAPAGPTVILNAAYLTDTLLTPGSAAVGNGDPVESWAMATGGTFNYGLAASAGANVNPVYVTASGVHTDGGSAALTCATPVVIPADTDCVIYVKCVLAGFGDIIIGKSNNAMHFAFGGGAGWYIQNAAGAFATLYGEPTDSTFLARARRVSGVWYFAWTGQAETVSGGGTLGAASLSFDTVLGYASSGGAGTLDTFPPAGQYIQKIKILSGTSDPDTAYETANGGTL